jgi:general secretion pathway protein J
VEGFVIQRRGFTLVELLVVLLLIVLIAGSAAAFMRVVAGAREVSVNRLHGEQEATVAMRTIVTAIRNVYRPVTDTDLLFEGVVERSDPVPMSRLRLRTVDRRIIRRGEPESDVHQLEFFIREDNGRQMLMRRSDPTKNADPDRGGVVEPLAEDVVGLDLQYLDAGKWEDRWPDTLKRLPAAVNVRLLYRADDAPGGRPKIAAISRIVNFADWSGKSFPTDETPTQ